MITNFDVIVVGGGHAGVEAASAAARMGAQTALVTQKLEKIGEMSCNPAFGGLGKGHLVREIDALDGIMGRAADQAAIQFRLLNRRKGPAVQGPRVQADRRRYKKAVKDILAGYANLFLIEGECEEVLLGGARAAGIRLCGAIELRAGAVVVTAGTFLNGVIHRGVERVAAGRVGDAPSQRLANQFLRLGFKTGRLKTGTPPRLDGRSIDFNALDPQWGDDDRQFLSTLTTLVPAEQSLCFITRTTPEAHRIVRENIGMTAVYSGAITGSGPRYCPSIEDKVVRFAERASHQVFLEPEGLDTETIYPNGISTSLPSDVQQEFVRSIPGLQRAKITQPGYAIEYDYFCPTQLFPTLMSRRVPGLFLAGQVNGTTGYEEAGAQGVIAGANAALLAGQGEPYVISRDTSYIGVMISDLTSKGVTEPYRMFTSRAEFRLSLRADNADERLTPAAMRLGLASVERVKSYVEQAESLTLTRRLANGTVLSASELREAGFGVVGHERKSAFAWCANTEVELEKLTQSFPALAAIPSSCRARIDADAKYSVYVERQAKDMARQREAENMRIPEELDFERIAGLSNELKSRFQKVRPLTIGEASRLEGVTPASLMLLTAHARRAVGAARVGAAAAPSAHEPR